jgi:hypothetical protein
MKADNPKRAVEFIILLTLTTIISSFMLYSYWNTDKPSAAVFILFPIAYFSLAVFIKTLIDNHKNIRQLIKAKVS